MSADQILTDLCAKVSDDVISRVSQSAQWIDNPSHRMMIAVAGTASALGMALGFHSEAMKSAGVSASPDELVDAMWSMLRPMVLKGCGDSDADYKALLAQVRSKDAR